MMTTPKVPNIKEMSLQDIYVVETSIEARKKELLAEFNCPFTNTPLGYAADLTFKAPAESVILLLSGGLGRFSEGQTPSGICLPHQVYHHDLATMIRQEPNLTKIEVVGVSKEQTKTIWEANPF